MRGRWRVEGSAAVAGQTPRLLRQSMVAVVTGRITKAMLVDQVAAIPMMVLAIGTNTTKDRVALTMPGAAGVAVVTTKEIALAVGTTKEAVMAAVAVRTSKEAARACTLSVSCRSTPRSLRSPHLTTSQVHLAKVNSVS